MGLSDLQKQWANKNKSTEQPEEPHAEPEVPGELTSVSGRHVRWDYKTVVLTGGFMGRHKDELRRDVLEQQFDALGQEGWELVWILMNQALQGEKDGHVVIFKRPMDAETQPHESAADVFSRPPGQPTSD
jgi:hypothetical protein